MASERTGILASGNWVVDHIKTVDHYPGQDQLASILGETKGNGGGPYNVLKDLSRLGFAAPLEASGRLGRDDDAEWILDDCKRHRIDVRQLHRTEGKATSYTVVVSVASTGRRTFFHQRGANAVLDVDDVDFFKSQAAWFYFGYPMLLDTLDKPDPDFGSRSARLLAQASQYEFTTVVDLVSCPGNFDQVVRPCFTHTDYLLLNEWEGEQLTGINVRAGGGIDRGLVRDIVRRLKAEGVRRGVIMHLEEGACAATADGEIWQPSVQVPKEVIKGTNGAGDAFAAGVLYGLHEGWDLQECLKNGCAVAASCLLSPTTSDGIDALAAVRKRADDWGWRAHQE